MKRLILSFVCLFWAGSLYASTTLVNFDNLSEYGNNLNSYGASFDPKLTFSDGWVWSTNGNTGYASEFEFTNTVSTPEMTITFGKLVNDLVFDYSFTGYEKAKVNVYGDGLNNLLGSYELISSELFNSLSIAYNNVKMLGFVIFSTSVTVSGGSIRVDNVSSSPVPVPAAALLLGAGLLGIVGVRRRQLS